MLKKLIKINPRPAIFLHIQKTAGSSIVEYARKYYSSVISHGDFSSMAPEELNEIEFISGHFGYEFARPYMHDRFSFVFLRDPVERVLSYYYYCRRRDPDEFDINRIARENNLEQFLELGLNDRFVQLRIVNNQAWQLALGYGNRSKHLKSDISDNDLKQLALEHLNKFSYIGFTETFKRDRRQILRALNLPILRFQYHNKINQTKDRPGRNDISPDALEMIQKLTCVDQSVYDEAWSRKFYKK